MTRVAVKHMTEEQAREEAQRIDERLYMLRRQIWALDDKGERAQFFAERWLRRLDRIAKRLMEICKGATPASGEVARLFEDQAKIMARWQCWLHRYRDIVWIEKEPIRREMDALYRRSRHVTKRRWQHNHARLGPVTPEEYIRSLD